MVKNTKVTKPKKKATKPLVKDMKKVVIPAPSEEIKKVTKKVVKKANVVKTKFTLTLLDKILVLIIIALSVALIIIKVQK